jgi:hypothetical protein
MLPDSSERLYHLKNEGKDMNEKEEVLNRMTNRLNLYRISQSVNEGYDTYSDAIVAAHDEEEARHINPRGGHINPRGGHINPRGGDEGGFYSWAEPKDVVVELVGVSIPGTEVGVICASFHGLYEGLDSVAPYMGKIDSLKSKVRELENQATRAKEATEQYARWNDMLEVLERMRIAKVENHET